MVFLSIQSNLGNCKREIILIAENTVFLLFIHTSSSDKEFVGCEVLYYCIGQRSMKTCPLSQVLLLLVDCILTCKYLLSQNSLSVATSPKCLSSQKNSICRKVAASSPQVISLGSFALKGTVVQRDPSCA